MLTMRPEQKIYLQVINFTARKFRSPIASVKSRLFCPYLRSVARVTRDTRVANFERKDTTKLKTLDF